MAPVCRPACARAGELLDPDGMLSARDLEEHRTALTGHCYRTMGSAADAEDAVQETMVRAWRGLERFEEQAKPSREVQWQRIVPASSS